MPGTYSSDLDNNHVGKREQARRM